MISFLVYILHFHLYLNNQNYNNISSINNNRNFDSKLHVRNPVPLSKLQIAENKYYQIKAEIEEKFFNNNLENLDSNENAKYTQEMISYLEKLNDVLTQIISNTKIKDQKSGRNKSPSQVKDPELLYQEQQYLNELDEKKKEEMKKRAIKEKEMRDKQQREQYVTKRIAFLKNKKYEKELVEHNKEEIRLEKEAIQLHKNKYHLNY